MTCMNKLECNVVGRLLSIQVQHGAFNRQALHYKSDGLVPQGTLATIIAIVVN